ncbi:hypothetical protein [Phyllobacterium phragmitis]|uniref:hypothetical protein n=1 Tax=Phyllobacterium phragmitis TaxID=2670329 RepID=UPI001304EDC4|nr:hypothetical protein [Phyllobacterium phragmitis]
MAAASGLQFNGAGMIERCLQATEGVHQNGEGLIMQFRSKIANHTTSQRGKDVVTRGNGGNITGAFGKAGNDALGPMKQSREKRLSLNWVRLFKKSTSISLRLDGSVAAAPSQSEDEDDHFYLGQNAYRGTP